MASDVNTDKTCQLISWSYLWLHSPGITAYGKGKGKVSPLQALVWPRGWVEV